MKLTVFFAAGITGLIGVANVAEAACRTTPFRFFPAQNDHVTASVESDSKGCTHRYRAGASTFNESAIVAMPKNGRLSKVENFAFRYVPKPGFVGRDTYSTKICGSGRQGSGCSTITYEVDVK